MRKLFLFTMMTLILASQSFSQSPKIEFTEYDLSNGLHVILHQDNSLPIVAVTTTFHVGSKNEDPKRTGFAHFFEHLMFEGSDNIKRGEIDNIIQNAGGQLNASTSFDETKYYFILPSNQLELGLWIESERMLHAKVDSTGVETQRSVVKEERRQSIDNRPYGSMFEQVFSHSFSVHPYRWTPIGSFQYIDQATIEEFRDFYHTYYVPNNAVLSISGDIDIAKTKQLIDAYYSAIPKGTRPMLRPTEVEPVKTAEVRDSIFDNIQLPAVIQAYHIPAQTDKDYYAIAMLTNLLSEGQSSRLYKALVDDKKVAVYSGSFPMTLENPGLFIVYSVAAFGKSAADNEVAMDVEISKVQKELISDEEFQKLRNQVESDIVKGKNKQVGIAYSLAENYLFFGNTNLINTEIEGYMAVTKEDLKHAAQQYFNKENRTILYYLPKAKKN